MQDSSCAKCNYKSRYKESLKRHYEVVHEGFKVKCSECGLECSRKQTLKKHIATKHLKETRTCPYCSIYLNVNALDDHIREKHNSYFTCSICDYKTLGLKNLKRHIKSVHDDRIKDYKCDLCAYEAVQLGILRQHKIKVHK